MSQPVIIESVEADALERLLPLVEKHFGHGETFLFGSRARRDYRNHSDIDLIHVVEVAPDENAERRKRDAFHADRKASGVPFSVQVLVFAADRIDPNGLNPPTFREALRDMLSVQALLDAYHDPANTALPPTRIKPGKRSMFMDYPPEDPWECLTALCCDAVLRQNGNGQWMLVEADPDHPFEPDALAVGKDIVIPLIERGYMAVDAQAGETWRATSAGIDAWGLSGATGVSPFDDNTTSQGIHP
jgi:predicted nucleotidyltransferase